MYDTRRVLSKFSNPTENQQNRLVLSFACFSDANYTMHMKYINL